MKYAFAVILALVICGCDKQEEKINGYVEGEFIYVAPTTSGILKNRYVSRGNEVKTGDILFEIDTTNLEATLNQANAEVEKAVSNYTNLTKGKRPEEIQVITKQKEQAQANLVNAKKEFKRYQELAKTDYASQASLDEKTAAYKALEARVQELTAELKVATLGARDDEIKAAQAAVDAAKQKVVQAQQNIDDAKPRAIKNGRVEDTYFRAGEYVGAGSPVVAFLPPENIKIRFFISQKMLPKMQHHKPVKINCDGCDAPIDAKITFIASKAEFTPPVIYSIESRDKLVFMIEARPLEFNPQLRPGLPINITLN